MKIKTTILAATFCLAISIPLVTKAQQVDLVTLNKQGNILPLKKKISKFTEGKYRGIYMHQAHKDGLALLKGLGIHEGSIEIDLKGRDSLQKSFLGIAFNVVDSNTYEAVYFRPFNFNSKDSLRRQHAVQYVAVPNSDWKRLREVYPGIFENKVNGYLNPSEWFHLRLEINDFAIKVFVNGGKEPVLAAIRCVRFKSPKIALMTGDQSDGYFSNLKIYNTSRLKK